jgi:hypothetical protein
MNENSSPLNRKFRGPVRWLLGGQLIAGLKYIALYSGFKSKLDHRDWMYAQCFDRFENYDEPEFWFDYAADAGDDEKAAYSLAYLYLTDIDIGHRKLPRGEFLFVGGDTAYHIADYPTLAERFQKPFRWAYKDLKTHRSPEIPWRPIFGLPGNHDYYDALDGFNRQFARPHSPERKRDLQNMKPQLSIPGFERLQTASYVALRLPFGWQLWGIDCETGKVDVRQQQFFKELYENGETPKKLILCTSVPTTVFGRAAAKDEPTPKALDRLGLSLNFIPGEKSLPKDNCRLDLAGDVHHYARYCTSPAGNYASVVSGGGGAFLHPSDTKIGHIKAESIYPDPKVSRLETANRLFNFANIFTGGYVCVIAAFISMTVYFAATVPVTTKTISDSWVGPESTLGRLLSVKPLAYDFSSFVNPLSSGDTLPGTNIEWTSLFLPFATLVVLCIWVGYSKKVFGSPISADVRSALRQPDTASGDAAGEDEEDDPDKDDDHAPPFSVWARNWPVAIVLATLMLLQFWFKAVPSAAFAQNMLILIAVVGAISIAAEASMFSDFLMRCARTLTLPKWRLLPLWALALLSFLLAAVAIFRFGKAPAAYMVSDIIATLVLLLLVPGLAGLAAGVGAILSPLRGKGVMAVFGLWFGLLLLLTPIVLIRADNIYLFITLVPVVFVFNRIGAYLMGSFKRALLLLVWFVFGATVLFGSARVAQRLPSLALGGNLYFHLFLAILIGLGMGIVWFGWYLAVCSAFNGHNNEVGGAARIGTHKHFIRFCLTRNGLAGYVIALDQPQEDGRLLEPKVVDQFIIRPAE